MTKEPDFDTKAAHKYFAAQCFNKAWDLIEKSDRTAQEDEEMIQLGLTSLWHWTQREDCTPTNLSVSYWQISRIYAILGQAHNARVYGQRCLDVSQGDEIEPIFLGYAYEALARAELVADDREKMQKHLDKARKVAGKLSDPDSKKQLLDDLSTVQ